MCRQMALIAAALPFVLLRWTPELLPQLAINTPGMTPPFGLTPLLVGEHQQGLTSRFRFAFRRSSDVNK